MLVEEFKRCIQSDVKTFLDEKKVETLEEAARLADDYYLTHKVSFIAKPKPTSSHPQNRFMSGNSSGMPSQSNTPKPSSTSETKSQYPLSRPTCNYCKKPGHLVSECLKLKRKLESDEAKPTGLTTLRPRPQSSIKTNTIDIVTKPKSDSTMEIFEPFMLNAFVSLSGDNCPPTPIKILRDTGASQSLILADILPFSEKTSSGTSVLIQGVECGTVNIPLHHVNLSSDLVTGLVVIGITPSLPFKGVHLLLGKDLAGDKVVVNPLVTDTPNIDQMTLSSRKFLTCILLVQLPELWLKRPFWKTQTLTLTGRILLSVNILIMRLKSLLIPVCLILRQTRQCLVILHQGLLTKVTTRCQSHSLSRSSKLILRFQN